MLCDFLELNKTNMKLYHSGSIGMKYCKEKHPEIAEIYSKYLQWMFDELPKMDIDKSELTKIFKVGKQYTDAQNFEAFLKFFIAQTCGIAKYVAKKQGMESKLEQNFSVFEEFGKSIKQEIDCSLVFNLGGE